MEVRTESTPGVAAVEDQPGDPLGVACGVLDGDRAALRHREQREALEPGVVDDRLEVGDPQLEGVVGDVAVGQAVAALVEADRRWRSCRAR